MKYTTIKRIMDIIVAVCALVILSPLFVIIGIWIKSDSRGPVIFSQKRYGKDKQPFTAYKFRTMSTDAPSNVPTNSFHTAGSYITKSGRILRKLSLDELPQLVNVLQGHMSIVGPRPVVLTEVNLINEREKYGANNVKPGITGWAQVNGRDELNDAVKARMDGEYVRHINIATDVWCLMRTLKVICSLAGHREGHEQNRIKSTSDMRG